jgi:hypothetical protein
VADTRNSQLADPAEALERFGRLSLRELSMDSLLQTVADLTKSVMPGKPRGVGVAAGQGPADHGRLHR